MPEQGEIVDASATWEEPARRRSGRGRAARASSRARSISSSRSETTSSARARATSLEELGCRVHAAVRDEPQRRVFTFVDSEGERTITSLGTKLHPHGSDPLPWEELAEIDAVYFSAGDADALRAARQARVLVATARELPTLVCRRRAARRRSCAAAETRVRPMSRASWIRSRSMVVSTMGREGGTYRRRGSVGLVGRGRATGTDRERVRSGRFLRCRARVRPRPR